MKHVPNCPELNRELEELFVDLVLYRKDCMTYVRLKDHTFGGETFFPLLSDKWCADRTPEEIAAEVKRRLAQYLKVRGHAVFFTRLRTAQLDALAQTTQDFGGYDA
jgi:uncharacterized protein YdaU (DUF1376 family)